jgi:glucose-6-phosphate 1-dehydrogenase
MSQTQPEAAGDLAKKKTFPSIFQLQQPEGSALFTFELHLQ